MSLKHRIIFAVCIAIYCIVPTFLILSVMVDPNLAEKERISDWRSILGLAMLVAVVLFGWLMIMLSPYEKTKDEKNEVQVSEDE